MFVCARGAHYNHACFYNLALITITWSWHQVDETRFCTNSVQIPYTFRTNLVPAGHEASALSSSLFSSPPPQRRLLWTDKKGKEWSESTPGWCTASVNKLATNVHRYANNVIYWEKIRWVLYTRGCRDWLGTEWLGLRVKRKERVYRLSWWTFDNDSDTCTIDIVWARQMQRSCQDCDWRFCTWSIILFWRMRSSRASSYSVFPFIATIQAVVNFRCVQL